MRFTPHKNECDPIKWQIGETTSQKKELEFID